MPQAAHEGIEVDPTLAAVYEDLHRHPELGFQEERTAAIVAHRLTALGFEVTTGIGRTGVAGVLRNGSGPTALLRADMDALPVREDTGLDYASTATATDATGKVVPVGHACGHDLHTTCLLGAAAVLAGDPGRWRGTLVVVFQPAEELGAGARAMVDDGLFERVPTPDVVLGQHVAPLPAGTIAAYAGSDSPRVTIAGRGAHGSMPQNAIDPVVTVGSIHAGDAANVIPDEAELQLDIRSYTPEVRQHILDSVSRIARGEAATAGAPQEPTIVEIERFPVVVDDVPALGRTLDAFARWLGPQSILDPGAGAGSEDVGVLATSAGAPLSYWLLGGTDPSLFTTGDLSDPALRTIPSNHSPRYAPAVDPTLDLGVTALVTAARTWLPAA
jgi:metal-dependent amidase/aminoacylase/carboxypeptidase family protein